MVISNEEFLLRRVSFYHVREDGTISELAYCPKFPRDDDGVSVGIKTKINSKTKLRSFNWGISGKSCVCELLAIIPRQHNYDCVYKIDSDKHGLIVGDMNKLVNHHEALADFSSKSDIIFCHPYEDWIMKPSTDTTS